MSRRGINDETRAVSIGPATLDVEMARDMDWSELDIARTWQVIEAAVLATNQQAAKRRGHTRKCPDCECWTAPTGQCHLCAQDRQRAAAQREARP